jgi:hypothetical protein
LLRHIVDDGGRQRLMCSEQDTGVPHIAEQHGKTQPILVAPTLSNDRQIGKTKIQGCYTG